MLPRTSKKANNENAPNARQRTAKYQAANRTRSGSGRIFTDLLAERTLSRWEMSDFLTRLRVHGNHFSRRMGSNEQPRAGLVKRSIDWMLACYGTRGKNM